MRKNQEGFAILYVLLIATALFLLLSAVMKMMYSFQKQDRQLRKELIERARELNARYPETHKP